MSAGRYSHATVSLVTVDRMWTTWHGLSSYFFIRVSHHFKDLASQCLVNAVTMSFPWYNPLDPFRTHLKLCRARDSEDRQALGLPQGDLEISLGSRKSLRHTSPLARHAKKDFDDLKGRIEDCENYDAKVDGHMKRFERKLNRALGLKANADIEENY